MTASGWAARAGVVVALTAVLLLYVFNTQPFRSAALASGLIIAIGALSLNVLIGYTGQISLGHQAFIGIGAFTAAYALSKSHLNWGVALVAGIAVGAIQSVLLGLVALRVRGLYFALVTLAWGSVGENSLFRLRSFTGGGAGQHAPRPAGFTTDRSYLLLCALALTVVLLVDWRLTATKAGRALQALRESPQVAANYGINVPLYTLFAFAVAGAYAGLAGALFASEQVNVVGVSFTFALIALPYLIVTVVGGLRRRGGIVVFALFYVLGGEYLPEFARNFLHQKFLADNAGFLVQVLSGVLAVATLIFQPDGLGTVTAPIGRWLAGGRFEMGGRDGSGAEGLHARP